VRSNGTEKDVRKSKHNSVSPDKYKSVDKIHVPSGRRKLCYNALERVFPEKIVGKLELKVQIAA